MTTNIIRLLLLSYTSNQCKLLNIPLVSSQSSGYFWDISKQDWDIDYADRLVINKKAYLLVPKLFVSTHRAFNPGQYLQHDVLNFLQNEHFNKDSPLVRVRSLKDGVIKKDPPTKKSLREFELENIESSKDFLRDFTRKHKEIFSKFKENRQKDARPLQNAEIADVDEDKIAEFLVGELRNIPTGNNDASRYHRIMIGISELLFFPNLTNPVKEKEINDGRKRVDLVMDNAAKTGFFHWIHDTGKIPSPYVYIECKNYKKDPENPEFDQLSGRLSVNRGMLGFLFFRSTTDRKKLIKHSIDLYKDKKELIIPIYDEVVISLLRVSSLTRMKAVEKYLTDSAREIISS